MASQSIRPKSKQLGSGELPAEEQRLLEDSLRHRNWKRWGPYLADRQWGTVREDYSEDGDAWRYFPHEHARSRAYRWGEDGLFGITDRQCRMCLALTLWNEQDSILKERLFGLANHEGNHGEDVKELYFHLDSTPTHSYLKALYKYPQRRFPYEELVSRNQSRSRADIEVDLEDLGVFDEGRYFDVTVEYGKRTANDLYARFTIENRGPDAAPIHVLPTLWFRNIWSWGRTGEGYGPEPRIEREGTRRLRATCDSLGPYICTLESCDLDGEEVPSHGPTFLFTNNETNLERLYGVKNKTPYVKDALHDVVVGGKLSSSNPREVGTKAAAWVRALVPPGGKLTIRVRLCEDSEYVPLLAEYELQAQSTLRSTLDHLAERHVFDQVIQDRIVEADAFYATKLTQLTSGEHLTMRDEEKHVARRAYAGLLWSKQYYHYSVKEWLEGDPAHPRPPQKRMLGRNREWQHHLYNRDIISVPDKWEYPWYAAWDLAFHMLPFANLDPDFAKGQLELFLREWYMHGNGQIPAYEWNFSDVNPPVHAWAAWRVYKLTAPRGHRDVRFLTHVFQKLLMNFTWWVNRKDEEGNNLFSGGFLGLDNIGLFDRSKPLPTGGRIEQADGTAWMAFYCTTMLGIAFELAKKDSAYEDLASKFFEHFVAIAEAMNDLGGNGLWNEEDGFYYDQIHLNGRTHPLKIRSMVGIIPLFAVEALDDEGLAALPGFQKRMRWFLDNRKDLARFVTRLTKEDGSTHRLLAIPSPERLKRVLRYVLDEQEFLSPYGVRSLSKVHDKQPYELRIAGELYRVAYVPGDSDSGMFGGNSNWRGPVWLPVNYLLIESLDRYHYFYGDELKVECPTGSGIWMNLKEVATDLSRRLAKLFLPDENARRACMGADVRWQQDKHFRDLLLFHEYFNGDSGRGVGASHQTGWTALIVRCLGR